MNHRPSYSRLSRLAFQTSCCPCQTRCLLTRPEARRSTRFLPRHFTTTTAYVAKPINHYEVLGVAPNISKGDLKKQFYKLSKETHPDLHKNDPGASERFSQISESYSILANDEKRRRYDRDFMRQNAGSPGAGQSGTYAGSRPASGLSKRRGTFRGAPDSFYTQGGYGSTGRQSQAREQSDHRGGTFNASAFTERGKYDPDFDSDPIFRTQTAEDAKRSRRLQAAIDAEAAEIDRGDSFWLRFVIVTTIVVAGVSIGSIFLSMKNTTRGGMTRADGSRRDGPKNEWAKG